MKILILSKNDLVVNYLRKGFDNITRQDLNIDEQEFRAADIVIFFSQELPSFYQIIKNRHKPALAHSIAAAIKMSGDIHDYI